MNFHPDYSEKPWYKHRDEKPPRDYNPYTENDSVTAQVCAENADKLGGAEPLSWESPAVFSARRSAEDLLIKSSVINKLKQSGSFVGFALLITLLMMNSLVSSLVGFTEVIADSYIKLFSFFQMVLQYALVFPIVFYITTVGSKNKPHTFFKKPQASKFYIFRWVIIMLGITYGIAIASDIFFSYLQQLGLHINDIASPIPVGFIENIIYFLAAVILAPLCEEILFRGILLSKLRRFGGWFAVISTGVLFGLFHQNHSQLFFASAFGILAGFITLKTKSVIPSLIAHVCLNGYSYLNAMLIGFTDNYADVLAGTATTLEGPAPLLLAIGFLDFLVSVLIALAVVMLVIEIITNKSQLSLPKGDSGLRTGEKHLTFILSPLIIVMLLILISNIITYSFVDLEALMAELEQMSGMYQ